MNDVTTNQYRLAMGIVMLYIEQNPDAYKEVLESASYAYTKWKDNQNSQIAYTQMALSCISPKDARKLQTQINRELWPKPIQDIIDLRAKNKNLKDLKNEN